MASLIVTVLLYISLIFIFTLKISTAQIVPAMFVFGDSTVDVGNNNHLTLTLAKANLPHYGIDFPTHKPTGRFSNGKNPADFLAEKLGLPSPRPYLSLMRKRSSNFVSGVSFASAAAGILNGTNEYVDIPTTLRNLDETRIDDLSRFTIPMDKQVEYYMEVQEVLVRQLGQARAAKLLSGCLFVIVIGSTDVGYYFEPKHSIERRLKKDNPREYVDLMASTLKGQLKRIHDLWARKFVIVGVPGIGCAPIWRAKNKNGSCNETVNHWASQYNLGLQKVLQELKLELNDFQYSYFDTYAVLLNLIQEAASYGFEEVKAACCGLGNLNADTNCSPITSLCPNRSDHVFWDVYHPSEAVIRILVEAAFDGPRQYAFPVNVRQLVSM